ncbi:transducin/WD40 repeat-like superfamily protein isoform X2 [Wolffia australiana]
MDWCPRVASSLQHAPRCEYLAVSAHPTGSSYHNIGARLTGRGIIQIWCIPESGRNIDFDKHSSEERPIKGSFRSPGGLYGNSQILQKPRGRPRKTNLDCDKQFSHKRPTKGSSRSPGGPPGGFEGFIKPRGRPRKSPLSVVPFEVNTNLGFDDQSSMERPMNGSFRSLGGPCDESEVSQTPGGRPRKNPLHVVPFEVNAIIDNVNQSSMERPMNESFRSLGGLCSESEVSQKPRGRPRKTPLHVVPIKVNTNLDYEKQSSMEKPMNGSFRSPEGLCSEAGVSQKPRGRPRKNPLHVVPVKVDTNLDYRKQSSVEKTMNGSSRSSEGLCSESEVSQKPRGRPRKNPLHVVPDKVDTNLDYGKQSSVEKPMNESFRSPEGLCSESEVSQKPRGRPRKNLHHVVPVEVNTNFDYEKQSSMERPINGSFRSLGGLSGKSKVPLKPKGVPKKSVLSLMPLEDLSDCLKSNLHKKRGRPQKVFVFPDSVNDLNVGSCILPSKRPRGRPRKVLQNKETTNRKEEGKELNKGESTSYGRHIDEFNVEEPAISLLNGKSTSKPCKKRGRPRKVSVRMDGTFGSIIESMRNTDKNPNSDPLGTATDLSPVKSISSLAINSSILACESSTLKEDLEKSEHGLLQCLCEDSVAELVYPGRKELPLDTSIVENSCLADDIEMRWIDGFVIASDDVFQEYQTNDGSLDKNIRSSSHEENSKAIVTRENEIFSIYPTSVVEEEITGRQGQVAEVIHKDEVTGLRELMCIDDSACSSIKDDLVLPRVVLCLGHNGKVAWDVKWRPCTEDDEISHHRLGYLAAVLGDGSLEVWEIPTPNFVRNLYMSSLEGGTDPRFVKLRPVFKCSEIKCGSRQSIPLTLEWSKPEPDLILVGCHDGTVALWKFCAGDSFQDTRPLLCFTADNVPIRAVCWAPGESYSRRPSVFVTAGHEGIKFWDLRDPYRPLWDFNPAQKIILSLDWLLHPSCLIFAFDDGSLKTLSLSKAACNVHVTGKPFDGAKHGVLHNYYRSQFAIWSVHASPVTAVAAYCCADGSTFCFQMTEKSVDKDKSRYRLPHYLCGTLHQEAEPHDLTVRTPLPNTAIPDLPRRPRGVPPHSKFQISKKEEEFGDDLKSPVLDPPEKRRISSKKAPNKSQDAIVAADEQENDEDFLAFPPKIVAMHRVRWNTNPGSERWLCSGGAAGIIRCQLIDLQHP